MIESLIVGAVIGTIAGAIVVSEDQDDDDNDGDEVQSSQTVATTA